MLFFGLPFSGIRDYGSEGASGMFGRVNGLQAKVLTEDPKAVYIYCFGHQLNLIVPDFLKAIPGLEITMERIHAVVHIVLA